MLFSARGRRGRRIFVLGLIPAFTDFFTRLAHILFDLLGAALQFLGGSIGVAADLSGGGIVPLRIAITRCECQTGGKHEK
jgi:hypothetical protein